MKETNPRHVDEELEDEGREAWQVLGQLRAAENGVFKILQLLVEEGHKVVQLRPGGVLHTAVSGEKKNQVKLAAHGHTSGNLYFSTRRIFAIYFSNNLCVHFQDRTNAAG